MTYIIRDCSIFWSYDTALATPVSTANCGMLTILACGEVRFTVNQMDGTIRTICLHDCLHVPNVPINLLSVGSMQEKCMKLVFDYCAMTIHLHDCTGNEGILEAAFIHRLLFLQCIFILSPSSPIQSPLVANLTELLPCDVILPVVSE